MSKWESGISTNLCDLFSILGDCHVVYHFPNSTSNDSCFMPYNLHRATYFYSKFFQAGETLQPVLMAMAGPHCLDMIDENDQICISVLDSHRDPLS